MLTSNWLSVQWGSFHKFWTHIRKSVCWCICIQTEVLVPVLEQRHTALSSSPVGRAGAQAGMWRMPVFWGRFWNEMSQPGCWEATAFSRRPTQSAGQCSQTRGTSHWPQEAQQAHKPLHYISAKFSLDLTGFTILLYTRCRYMTTTIRRTAVQ